jgi:hypothetical protein
MPQITTTGIALASEVKVPEPEVSYRHAEYSASITVRDAAAYVSISTRPYRTLKDGSRRYAPDIMHKSVGFTSNDTTTAAQANLVAALSAAVEAVVAEAG